MFTDSVYLFNPSADHCKAVISTLEDSQQVVNLSYSFPDIVLMLVPKLLSIRTVEKLTIEYTELTHHCILSLASLLARNDSLKVLSINNDSIGDNGVITLAESLRNNVSLQCLYLHGNLGITSASTGSLVELLRYNGSLSALSVFQTSIDTDGALALVDFLITNSKLKLALDEQHEDACHLSPNYEHIKERIYFLDCFEADDKFFS